MSPQNFNCAIFRAVGRTAAGVLFGVTRERRQCLFTRYYQRNLWRFGWLSPRYTLVVAIIVCHITVTYILHTYHPGSRSQWPRGLRRRSVAARLLRSWVRIPPRAWICCLLWVLCVVRYRSLRRADHSSRGVLPTVVASLCVIWKPREWGGLVSVVCCQV